jgi:hypothetical protein
VWPEPDADAAAFDEPSDDAPSDAVPDAPVLESADLELALRYLPDYRVLVIADPLPAGAIDVAVAAAGWSGAALVVLVPTGTTPPELASEATVMEAPTTDPDDAFASVVGAYAAALDRGEEPGEAFATASTGGGWSAVSE